MVQFAVHGKVREGTQDDRAAADAHTSSPHMQAFFEKVGPMMTAGPIVHPVVATAKG